MVLAYCTQYAGSHFLLVQLPVVLSSL